ncbi:MAG TPA: amidohydrolase family protein [Puia sp.]|jgi:cytosine/adenosine deaminase-related metal-dependent hydrolase|nr:amidohydrolase family protein [Puia sp.]
MSYRKLKADYLFDGYKMQKSVVLICTQNGIIETIVDEDQAGEGIENLSGILSPGFINCHCHLELSHLKGLIQEKQGLVDFVLSVIGRRQLPEELKLEAILNAESDMSKTGIVAVGDICNTSDTRFLKSAGGLDYYNFIEVLGWSPGLAHARFENGKKTAGQFIETGADEKYISLSPHAPYSVSNELWSLLEPGFGGKTITIHNQESASENEFFMSGKGDLTRMYSLMKMDSSHFKAPGKRSLAYYLPNLKNASRILLVHNTYTNEADLIEAQGYINKLFFCFCPNANIYIEDQLPDIPLFLKYKTRIVLGTDSLASNHQLSILEEMKTIKKAFGQISTSELLLWATSNGAAALSLNESLGDFKKGKKPGVVLIEKTKDGEITETCNSRRLI